MQLNRNTSHKPGDELIRFFYFNVLLHGIEDVCFFCYRKKEKYFFFIFSYKYLKVVCRVFLSVHCSLVVTCWERAGLLALLCVMFYCVFVTFPCCGLGQVCCLIVLMPDICLLSYFYTDTPINVFYIKRI